MIKTFQVDYVRAVLEYGLSMNNRETMFNDNDIRLISFFEHLASDDEVNRYVETYNDLISQQNRQHEIGVGIVGITSIPEITNIRSAYISPFGWSCIIRSTLENRDKMIESIYNVFENLKGRKIDIAELKSGKLVCVGTMFSDIDTETNSPMIKANDYIGVVSKESIFDTFSDKFRALLYGYTESMPTTPVIKLENEDYLYCDFEGKLTRVICRKVEDTFVFSIDETFEREEYKKYKLAISFDDATMEQPYTLDSNEYCEISFNGQATLCDHNVRLNKDIVRTAIKRLEIKGTTPHIYNDEYTWLETLENDSDLATNQITEQLRSNFFKQSSHTDSINPTIQFTFVLDENIELLNNLYNYARYGECSIDTITPNIEYELVELKSYWGNFVEKVKVAKLNNNIGVNTNENGTITLTLTFSIER